MSQKGTPGRIKTKVRISAVKIHGPNSPDVQEGRVFLGEREGIAMDKPEQTVEMTEDQVREYFGNEIADLWFGKEDE